MISLFLAITFGVSWIAGVLAFRIGGDRTFEAPRALPLLLLMIWSPDLAAWIVTARAGDSIETLLAPLWRSASAVVWLGALTPLAIAAAVARRHPTRLAPGRPGELLAFTAFNLAMGPTGEELGWRGVLLPELAEYGLVAAGVVVGVIWAIWHAPLWLMPSPHRAIPFPLFFATVVCFSMTMTALWVAGNGALGPIVVFHLCANVGIGWLELVDGPDAATAYRWALPFHVMLALAATAWLLSSPTMPAG